MTTEEADEKIPPLTTTAVVQIGNSDDKLTQKRWAAFIVETAEVITSHAQGVHFSGASMADAPWQNHAWVFEISARDLRLSALQYDLTELAYDYEQDSIALTTGVTEFVRVVPTVVR